MVNFEITPKIFSTVLQYSFTVLLFDKYTKLSYMHQAFLKKHVPAMIPAAGWVRIRKNHIPSS